MIDELKALLRNEENLDERELHYEFEQLTDRYQFEEEYSYIFEGLRILYERLHPIYNRIHTHILQSGLSRTWISRTTILRSMMTLKMYNAQ